ncbi:hypothetical protein LJ655_01305 [Paraburkholderia sp. MMS20-SJTN17]|uniref:Uncharacterized protein n=1 Tax=Paraburkholderia translucens TaxID=2886945 RepID=A0ABS8K724_9BURK|nr:hypothetical protein [Paraburkholderia sp. MMS20-SJTN17]
MIDRAIAVNPRLRLAQRHKERLGHAVAISLGYIDKLTASLPASHEANAAAWSTDPFIRAFFATPDDLTKIFSRSEELRGFFARNADHTHAYATLGMAMYERRVLGVALEGELVRHDVVQTKLCFSDHRVIICGGTESDLRAEIARRLVDQLALEGLARLAADRRDLVAKGRELLEARVALLERQGVGMRSVLGDRPDADADELARLKVQIEDNARNLAALRVPTEAVELELDRVCDVYSHPTDHLYVERRSIRLDLMNVIRQDDTQASHEIEFRVARIPGDPPRMRAFALVRYPRAELLPAGLHIDAAMRAL